MTYCFGESSSPSAQSTTPPHVYKATLPVIEEDLDSYIVSFKDHSLKYICKYPDCKGRRDSKTKQHRMPAIFTSKSNARNHVRRDMNIVEAFQCSCGQTFGSEDSAKRHCNTKSAGKVHECPECGHGFERKDYWEVHVKERKCRRANRVSPPQQPQLQLQLEYSPPQPTHHLHNFNLLDFQPSYTHYNNAYSHHCAMQYPDTMDYVHINPNAYAPQCSVYYN